jgi:hypothetical protein
MAWIPSSWPKEHKFEQPNTPLILVHISKYADATAVALNLPHAFSDQMGFGSMITHRLDQRNPTARSRLDFLSSSLPRLIAYPARHRRYSERRMHFA